MLEALRDNLKTAAINPRMLMALLGVGGLGALAAWGIPKAQSAAQGWNTNIGGRNRAMQGYMNNMMQPTGAQPMGMTNFLGPLRQQANLTMGGQ